MGGNLSQVTNLNIFVKHETLRKDRPNFVMPVGLYGGLLMSKESQFYDFRF